MHMDIKPIFAILLFTAFLLKGCGLFSNPDKRILLNPFGNDPNQHERLYYDLAGALASEKPCYLISHNSYIIAPGVALINTSGTVVQLQRSRCFSNVARLSMHPELCDEVKTANTFLYSGTANNPDRCREEASAQQRVSGNIIDSAEIVELADFSDTEINEAMIALGVFPNSSVLEAYRTEREEQFQRCTNRYVIYSEVFFNKIDDFPKYGVLEDLKRMQQVEWRQHPFIQVPGFTHCFLADGANHWSGHGVGAQPDRDALRGGILSF